MEKLKAKPVISGKYWILHADNKKVGQLEIGNNGYTVKIKGKHDTTFKTMASLKDTNMFDFIEIKKKKHNSTAVNGYPADTEVFNTLLDLEYNLPLFTKELDSKSWYAAGYYTILIKGKPIIEFCPKLITLQRNEFTGPYATKPAQMFEKFYE